jgi:hypothetical protein
MLGPLDCTGAPPTPESAQGPPIHTRYKDKVSLKEEQPVALVRGGLFLVWHLSVARVGRTEAG